MNTIFKVLVFALVILFTGLSKSFSQSSPKKQLNYSKHPYWIEMIDDTTTNYFDAIKAYDTFWKNHVKPKEEEETMGMKGATENEKKEKSNWIKRLFQNDVEKNPTMFTYQCKRFEHWKLMMLPYVQPDGSILYPNQRLQLWQNARQ